MTASTAKKQNKYEYMFVLQGNYGYGDGWEDLTASDSLREMRAERKLYRENEGGNYRIIQRRELRGKSQAKRSRTHAKTDVCFSETIGGVRIDYLTDWNFHLGKHITKGNERISTESYLRGYAGKLAELANKKGFKRVQVGSIGDFHYSGIRTGPFLPLDTMFLARFLKR